MADSHKKTVTSATAEDQPVKWSSVTVLYDNVQESRCVTGNIHVEDNSLESLNDRLQQQDT